MKTPNVQRITRSDRQKSAVSLRSTLRVPRYASRGVTFIEITIVISIFSILAGTLILNFSKFSRNVSIQTLAQDIALQINAAQKDAISGLTSPLIFGCDRTTSDCAPRYGLYFIPSDSTVMTKFINTDSPAGTLVAGKHIVRFFDHVDATFVGGPNGIYDASVAMQCGSLVNLNIECLDVFSVGQGNFITSICGKLANDSTAGDLVCDSTQIEGINISFKRPFPDAIIKNDAGDDYAFVRITVTSPNIDTLPRDIVVTKLGRVTIERTP